MGGYADLGILGKGGKRGQMPGQGGRYCDVGVFTVIV